LLELVEEALNAVSLLVEISIVGTLDLAIALGRDNDLGAALQFRLTMREAPRRFACAHDLIVVSMPMPPMHGPMRRPRAVTNARTRLITINKLMANVHYNARGANLLLITPT